MIREREDVNDKKSLDLDEVNDNELTDLNDTANDMVYQKSPFKLM